MIRILVVDDNSDMRELLGRELELLGFTPLSAQDGKEGVEKAVAEKPDLILMDLLMPVMDGWEATRRLRANPETRDIPILATTALFRSSELDACIEAGCDGYIIKPFTMTELENKIRELIH
jgi:CheY-like chemotaxis protein